MNLLVFSSNRSLNYFYQNSNDLLLPYATTIKDFLDDIIIVEEKIKIPKYFRSILLWSCINNIKIEKIGFDRTFIRFLKNSTFLFNFFDEIKSSMINIDDIDINDTYGDYEDHLKILKKIYYNYNQLLANLGFYDIKLNYRLYANYLKTYKNIHIYVDGVLSKFDFNLLLEASKYTNITIEFVYDKYNAFIYKNLFIDEFILNNQYIYDLNQKKIISNKKLYKNLPKISIYSFKIRINQSLLIIAKINEWLEKGIKDIAVILPDESFAKYLQIFDKHRNLNYAMGIENIDLINKIKKLKIDYDNNKSKFNNIFEALKEIDILKDILFELCKLDSILENLTYEDILEFISTQIPNIDDNYGGKVRVMGILESRGIKFDKLIIIDCNDGLVPSINNNDMFLNANIREKLGMPTLNDKENFQLHYYYNAITNANEVCLAFCSSKPHSKILDIINGNIINGDKIWSFFPKIEEKKFIEEKFIIKDPPLRLSASSINIFLKCKVKFYFNYLENLSSEIKEINNGTIIHNILKNIGKDFNITNLDDLIDDKYSYSKLLDIKVILKQLTPFFKSQKEQINNGLEILEIESPFEFIIDRFVINGKIDRVDRVGDTINIIDYKLANNFNPKGNDYMQLFIYKKALEKKYDGSEINAYYYDLYNNYKYIMSNENIKICEDTFNNLIKELKGELIFSKTESIKECIYCDYKYLCNRY